MGIIKNIWQFVKKTSYVSLCAIFLAFFFYSAVFLSSVVGALLCGVLAILAIIKIIKRKTIVCAVFAGFLCILALFNLQNRQKNIVSLIENETITEIYGICTNSPVKTESGSYLITVKCFAVCGNLAKTKIICGAKGFVNIILPQTIVENYYPGKIGTNLSLKTGSSFLLIDTGLPISVCGSFSKNNKTGSCYFYAQNAESVNLSIIKAYANSNCKLCQNKFLLNFYRIRAVLRIKLKKVLFNFGKSGWFLLALFCGSKEYLDPFLKQNFLRAGVSHILALSGLHLSLVSGGTKKLAGVFAGTKLTDLIVFASAWAFVLFASSAPSLNRALLFVFFNIFAKKMCVKPVLTKVLSVSFIVQLLFNAQQAQNSAFLLSYGAMLGIALFLPLFSRKIEKIHGFFQKICNTLATCFAAQCGTLLLTLFLYKNFVPFGVFASFVLIPLVSVFLGLGIFCTLLACFWPFTLPFLYQILNFFYNLIAIIAQFFANLVSFNI